MVAIKLPDGSVMNFDGAVSGKEVAEKISAGLAKNALAVKVNDKLQDLKKDENGNSIEGYAIYFLRCQAGDDGNPRYP